MARRRWQFRPCNLCGRRVRMDRYERFCVSCKAKAMEIEREHTRLGSVLHPRIARALRAVTTEWQLET